ncbi:Glu/Leu/Phe/Val family dehydrogenase [Aliiroseovarius crassostreae]|uniref:Amino acid dehydrogenase n=1 Tax=Aliiroseovarius crassostreae TaxID=154981 RepID=A0A9Q9HCI7_9RHOB|nr:Glu/Leu/Phe/Val dehydrogenase dimerization domain-containing protein [Aliiroseovarius crassostreae]UWP94762.1 amino acid dehydrogenase [Aliiroseovarius crassostreae]UWP97925.1 amino acid dehydrogenase [Aliiroseovarius crassostreae]
MTITIIASTTHEQILRVADPACGLVGFIAIHSTDLGPAAGGLRMRPYASEDEALTDVKRLSEGMTYKNAAAGLPLGGGKAVIMGDPATQKTPELLHAFGRAVEACAGRYWTAEDMGMTTADMAELAKETRYVAGLADGEFASGDPSPITARGIFNAIRRVALHQFDDWTLRGRIIAVQGLGNVGWNLCYRLTAAGAKLIVTDINPERVQMAVTSFGAEAVGLEEIYAAKADIFAPCAIGGILNKDSIAQLRVEAVAGGANNQLATPEDAQRLQDRGILYAPDFVANGGGIINVATEILGIENRVDWVDEKLEALDATMEAILTEAERREVSPADVALEVVSRAIPARQAQAPAA